MNTLYIIGNGFDLAHELPTCYSDFHDWLQYSGFDSAKQFVDSIHGLTQDVNLWKSFEEALGSIDLPQYINYLIEEYVDIQKPDDWIAQSDSLYAGLKFEITKQYEELLTAFGEWACSIEMDNCEKLDCYESINNPKNYFFTFNYTNTLEQIYNINNDRIMHIHGSATNINSSIILGHSHDYQTDKGNVLEILEETLPADSGDCGDLLLNLLNISIKQTKKIICENASYFNSLANIGITRIIVLGHSYGEVDMPYFAKIREVCPNAQWELNCFSDDDKLAANKMITKLSLSATII